MKQYNKSSTWMEDTLRLLRYRKVSNCIVFNYNLSIKIIQLENGYNGWTEVMNIWRTITNVTYSSRILNK